MIRRTTKEKAQIALFDTKKKQKNNNKKNPVFYINSLPSGTVDETGCMALCTVFVLECTTDIANSASIRNNAIPYGSVLCSLTNSHVLLCRVLMRAFMLWPSFSRGGRGEMQLRLLIV